MRVSHLVVIAAVIVGLSWPSAPLAAQAVDTFTARLGWVPITTRDRPNVTGKGSATAKLSGSTLSISGTFDGLAAPATVARLHRGVASGARGAAIADLAVTKSVSGTISGTVTLKPDQVEDLKQGRLYVQLHSEKGVEDGSVLWGWFLR